MRATSIALHPAAPGHLLAALAQALGAVDARPGRVYTARMRPEDVSLEIDARDLAASQFGDRDAFDRLVERHQQDVARMMARFTPDRSALEELVQDVFVEVWKGLGSFQRGRPFLPWLHTVAVHVGYRHWRSRARARRDLNIEDLGEIASASPPASPERATKLLHALLSELPPRDRLVLTLIHVEGHSVAETARLTGWSRVMVKVQAFRARSKVRALVKRLRAEGGRP